MFSARLTTDKTRRELITGQLDPNKQWSREQSLHPFFNHDASGDIFAGIDFTADACCSTDNGDRWTVIHNALTTSSVTNALTVSWNRAVFAGTYGEGVFRSTDRGQLVQASTLFSFFPLPRNQAATFLLERTSVAVFSAQRMIAAPGAEKNNGLIATDVRAIAINPVGTIFAETAGCGTGVYRSTDNGDSWSLANIGLTSTDVAALAVNGSNYHVFAGTHSIMGKGGGMFRSTDNGDTWTEQNGVSTM